MDAGPLDAVVQRICALAGADEDGDGELLKRFADGRDEKAFAMLVRRHGSMVLRVCQRVLGHAQEAEDAFQATFLILFRRAHTLKVRASFANWLYKVAYHVALEARASLSRRRRREQQVPEMSPAAKPDDPDDLLPVLDEELSRLPEKLRAPVVLCYLEGRTNQEAGRLLNLPVGTIKTRLAEARRRLRKRLTARGLTLSLAAVSIALAREGKAAVSGTLVQNTVKSTAALAAGKTLAASAKAVALANGASTTMFLSKLKTILLSTVLAVVVAGATAMCVQRVLSAQPAEEPAARAADEVKAEASPQPRRTVDAGEGQKVSAATLMQRVYDGLAWIGAARSFRIRTEYKITHTDAERRWQDKQPQSGIFSGKLDPRPFCSNSEWAWDARRIRRRTQSYYQGETGFNQQTRIWDGALAMEYAESADKKERHYVLGKEPGRFFEHSVTPMQLPWMLYGAHSVWWLPVDLAKKRDSFGVSPEDFELVGQETINGKPCHVVESRVGHYRMHIGVADGRLYRRTGFYHFRKSPGYNYLALLRKVGGPAIKTTYHWQPWLESLDPGRRRRAERDLQIAEFEFTQPLSYQTFDNYREVAAGCWLPFRETIDSYNLEAAKPFLASRSEETVTELAVNRPLADALFRIELIEGVQVATDWRYDPIIRYTYRKNQTEAERVALCEGAKKEQSRFKEEMERRQAVIKSRMGSRPLALPKSGWINGGPVSWEQLRGKVVVIHFWDVNCGPCQNELPFLARWHENSAESDIAVIGIHPHTDNLAAVRKKLEQFDAKYPVLIDAPANKSGGIGLVNDWFGNSWWPHTVLVNRRGLIAGHGQLWMGDIPQQMRRLGAEKN